MHLIVNKSTGEMRPASSPAEKTFAWGTGELELKEDEVLIDSSREVYNPDTGQVQQLPPRPPHKADLPARLTALEHRITTLEAALEATRHTQDDGGATTDAESGAPAA